MTDEEARRQASNAKAVGALACECGVTESRYERSSLPGRNGSRIDPAGGPASSKTRGVAKMLLLISLQARVEIAAEDEKWPKRKMHPASGWKRTPKGNIREATMAGKTTAWRAPNRGCCRTSHRTTPRPKTLTADVGAIDAQKASIPVGAVASDRTGRFRRKIAAP